MHAECKKDTAMKKWSGLMLFASLLLAATPALAAFNIFACTPEWGALAKELGGDKVSVYVATTALQDPHHVEARPIWWCAPALISKSAGCRWC